MRTILFLALLVGTGHAEETVILSSGTIFFSTSIMNSYLVIKPRPVKPMTLRVYNEADHVILYIDQDGDIFLRGKWIGKDARLPKIFGAQSW